MSLLSYRVLEPTERPDWTLVLLHGLGADERDLLGFGEELGSGMRVVTPRAPKEYEWGGFKWFDVLFTHAGRVVDPDEIEESVQSLIAFMEGLPQLVGSNPERTVLGGFSQGAMLSVGALLGHPDVASAGLLLSGQLLPQFAEQRPAPGFRCFVAHGANDPVIEVDEGRGLAAFLSEGGASVEYREYASGHEICWPELRDIQQWLAAL